MSRPRLDSAKIIAMDIETFDPHIELGPGVYRDDGCILGVSLATDDGYADYINIGHRGITEEERAGNIAFIKDVAALPVPKVGANFMYDIDWMENWDGMGIKIKGDLNDVQVAEPLLDEYASSFSLDTLAHKYLGEGKKKEIPQMICEQHGWKGDFRQHLWKMRYEDVREYAIGDARQPIDILAKQTEALRSQDLYDLYRMEMGLYPLLMKMRKNGVRIDTARRDNARIQLEKEVSDIQGELFAQYGAFNWNSSGQVAEVFDSVGIEYPLSEETGRPSITKDFLEECEHPIAKMINRGRTAQKIISTFIDGAFTDHCVDGRVHCTFKPVKRDDGGTVSGRFSSSDPNLQAIPSRDEEFSALCREILIPEEDCDWGKIDYSQIEYRFIAHYARGERAEEIRERYRNDPNTDYHKLVMEWTGVDRFTAKRLNFGMAYFMGPASMARKFHYTLEEARALQNKYMDNVPFMGPTRSAVVDVGRGRGYIKTILGRRARVSPKMRAMKKEYILFNRLIQGSAADLLKKSMKDSWDYGIYDILTPHITVHDEMGVSVPRTRVGREAYRELKHIMETAIPLKVPAIADAEIGSSWGTTIEICDTDIEATEKTRKEVQEAEEARAKGMSKIPKVNDRTSWETLYREAM